MRNKRIQPEKGATLLFVIIAMLVVAVIAAALFTLTTTSKLNQIEAQKSPKAFYMAESGIRVAAAEYANSANKNQTLLNLQGKTFTVGNAGRFTLQFYPYWLYVNQSYSANATSITVYFPGKLPKVNAEGSQTVTIAAPGILRLKGFTKVGIFTSAPAIGTEDANGTPITFTISNHAPCGTNCTGFPYAIPSGSDLLLGYIYNTEQVILQGGDLVFNDPNHTAAMYPPTNGSILVTPKAEGTHCEYTYERRIPEIIDPSSPPTSFTLRNIQSTDGLCFPNQFKYDSSDLSALYDAKRTTHVFLGKTLGIESTAVFGN